MPRPGATDRGVYERQTGWFICFSDPLGRILRRKIGRKSDAQQAHLLVSDLVRKTKETLRRCTSLPERKLILDSAYEHIEIIVSRHRSLTLESPFRRKTALLASEPSTFADEIHAALKAHSLIYYIQCKVADAPIKIGVAKCVTRRWKALQDVNPFPLLPLAVEYGNVHTERERHRQFSALRIQGEWFRSCPELMAFIQEIRKIKPSAHRLVDAYNGSDVQ